MSNFLTLEDVNTVLFNNQSFYWVEIDTSNITTGAEDYQGVQYDFCTVKREHEGNEFKFRFNINVNNWTRGYYVLKEDGTMPSYVAQLYSTDTQLSIGTPEQNIRLFLYMGVSKLNATRRITQRVLTQSLYLNLKQINQTQQVNSVNVETGQSVITALRGVNIGINEVLNYNNFLMVYLVKSDFQFNCTQSLTAGKVNTVRLGTLTDYKPNGDMIGDNTPNISVVYNDETIPVTWDSELDDYTFDLDLIDKTDENKVKFKVIIEANDVINTTETDVSLDCSFERINTRAKLTTLFNNGGIGRLTSNISLTGDLTVLNDVYIVGNDKTINLNTHKLIVPSNKTFKASNTKFFNGANSIQQNLNTKVELTNCTFTGCTGIGSVIDCQVDINSLENDTDFTTILEDCTISNCDMAILHGGDLTVKDCTVTGKIGDKDLPYFLYQTDGEAGIRQSNFSISNDTQISTDIQFNSCIFICGENAVINGLGYDELQKNDIDNFLDNNSSTIDLTYYYDSIEDYITIQADKGFCHSVSGADTIFKTNTSVRRVE